VILQQSLQLARVLLQPLPPNLVVSYRQQTAKKLSEMTGQQKQQQQQRQRQRQRQQPQQQQQEQQQSQSDEISGPRSNGEVELPLKKKLRTDQHQHQHVPVSQQQARMGVVSSDRARERGESGERGERGETVSTSAYSMDVEDECEGEGKSNTMDATTPDLSSSSTFIPPAAVFVALSLDADQVASREEEERNMHEDENLQQQQEEAEVIYSSVLPPHIPSLKEVFGGEMIEVLHQALFHLPQEEVPTEEELVGGNLGIESKVRAGTLTRVVWLFVCLSLCFVCLFVCLSVFFLFFYFIFFF
jgi:hypothetical protein